MTGYLIRRVLQSLLVLLGVVVVTFLLVHLLPGGPARAALGPKATPQGVAQFNLQNGLDHPLIQQFLIYLWHLLQGNLGFSYVQNQSVATLIGQNLPRDVILVGLSYVAALVIAIPLGMFQGARRNRPADYVLTGLSFVLYSMPSFLLGFLLIWAFAVNWQILPSAAPSGATVGAILGDPEALILPVATLALISIASFSRYMRSSVIENLSLDYVRTARAKGASERRILYRHILRNALIPIATLVGLNLPVLFGGALLTEDVFNYPGMGHLFIVAATNQDYPILLGVTALVAFATVIGSLLADVLYAVLDPRVRYVSA